MQRVTVWNEDQTETLGSAIEVADTSLRRLVGLLGRRTLAGGSGLWIRPSSGVHTFFMLFSIDVVGLDQDLRVVKLWNTLRPWRVTSVSLRMQSALELPAGTISSAGLRLGERLHMTPVEVLPG